MSPKITTVVFAATLISFGARMASSVEAPEFTGGRGAGGGPDREAAGLVRRAARRVNGVRAGGG